MSVLTYVETMNHFHCFRWFKSEHRQTLSISAGNKLKYKILAEYLLWNWIIIIPNITKCNILAKSKKKKRCFSSSFFLSFWLSFDKLIALEWFCLETWIREDTLVGGERVAERGRTRTVTVLNIHLLYSACPMYAHEAGASPVSWQDNLTSSGPWRRWGYGMGRRMLWTTNTGAFYWWHFECIEIPWRDPGSHCCAIHPRPSPHDAAW